MPSLLNPERAALLRDEKNYLVGWLASLSSLKHPPEELDDLRQALLQLDELFLIVVVGEFNAGKSALINALLGQHVLPEGVTPTTTRITLIKYGERAAEQVGDENFSIYT